MRDSDWKGKCGVPGIGGTSLNNIYKEPSSLWDDKQEEDSIKTRLLRFFKSRKKKKETKASDTKLDSSFTFPKLKVMKDNENVSNELSNSDKGYTSDNPNRSWTKRGIKRVKSLTKENPTERKIDKTKQIVKNLHIRKQTISVGTQTEPAKYSLKNHHDERYSDESIDNRFTGIQAFDLNISTEEKEGYSEHGYNLEIYQTLEQKPTNCEEEVLQKRRREVNSITISEMISPTLIMETELDTESESESDDDTVNIYEEVLNKESYQHRQHPRRLSSTSSLYSARGYNWGRRDPDITYYTQHFLSESNTFLTKQKKPKAKLSRTTKSSPISNTVIKIDNYKDSWNKIENSRGKEERRFKGLKKSLSEKLSSLRLYQSSKIFESQKYKYK